MNQRAWMIACFVCALLMVATSWLACALPLQWFPACLTTGIVCATSAFFCAFMSTEADQ